MRLQKPPAGSAGESAIFNGKVVTVYPKDGNKVRRKFKALVVKQKSFALERKGERFFKPTRKGTRGLCCVGGENRAADSSISTPHCNLRPLHMNVVLRSTMTEHKWWNRELTLKCKSKWYVKPMKDALGVSPGKWNRVTTRGKEKIPLTSVGIEPTTSGLDLQLLC